MRSWQLRNDPNGRGAAAGMFATHVLPDLASLGRTDADTQTHTYTHSPVARIARKQFSSISENR